MASLIERWPNVTSRFFPTSKTTLNQPCGEQSSIKQTFQWVPEESTWASLVLLQLYFFPEKGYRLMSQSIPTGYIPPGNPRENFFERANPGHPSKIFCLIPCPGAKNDGRIPGGGAKFSQTRRNCSLNLPKILKKLRKLRDSATFLFGELKKLLCFRLKQNNSKIFKYSSLDIQLKYSVEGCCSLTDSFVIYKSLVCIQFLQIIVIFPESLQTFTWGES